MRIADYDDYLMELSDKALIEERNSQEHASVDQIYCDREMDKRGLSNPPRKIWSELIGRNDTDNNEWELREEIARESI